MTDMDDLIQTIQSEISAEAMTAMEIGEAIGMGRSAVLARLWPLIKSGDVRCVTVQRKRIDGKHTSITGYLGVTK